MLHLMDPASVHCVVTSPPYFGLRDYDNAGQIGLEPTPDEYVAALVVALRHGRNAVLSELNPEYIALAHERIAAGK
jgi:DNA modification methylase